MSKTKKVEVEQSQESQEAGMAFSEQLLNLMGSIDDSAADEAAYGMAATAFVPASEVLVPTADDIAGARTDALFNGNASGKGVVAAKLVKHYDSAQYSQFSEALNFKEKRPTGTAMMGHGKTALPVPPSTRDNPAALYQYKDPRTNQIFKVRDKADKLLEAIFGETAWRVYEGAARSGFNEKPLVWVSQLVWHHMTLNKLRKNGVKEWVPTQHDPQGFYQYNEGVDESDGSPVLRAIGSFLDDITLQHLSLRARYENVSVLAVIRYAMWEVCTELGIPVTQPKVEAVAI